MYEIPPEDGDLICVVRVDRSRQPADRPAVQGVPRGPVLHETYDRGARREQFGEARVGRAVESSPDEVLLDAVGRDGVRLDQVVWRVGEFGFDEPAGSRRDDHGWAGARSDPQLR